MIWKQKILSQTWKFKNKTQSVCLRYVFDTLISASGKNYSSVSWEQSNIWGSYAIFVIEKMWVILFENSVAKNIHDFISIVS